MAAQGIRLKRYSSVTGYPPSTHDDLENINGTLNWVDSNQVVNQIFPAAGGGSFSNFIMSDGSNTQQVDDGETQLFTGGIAINGTVGATNQATFNWSLPKLTSADGTLSNNDYLGIYDISGLAHQRIALADLPTITSIDSSNDLFPVLDATDNRLKMVAGTNLPSGTSLSYAILRDEKATTTDGGSASATTWNARDLNTEVYDPDNIVSISSNQFTPISGTYLLLANAPCHRGNINRIRLYNVTGTASVEEGQNTRSTTTTGSVSDATLKVVFSANGTDAYRIDHFTSSAQVTNGLGIAVSDGTNEVYLSILLIKIG